MLDAELPAFDFIVLHGVYSWMPDAVRGEIRALIRRRLKPGGLVLVSYNALPGWAHIEPIRRMMRAWADGAPGDSLDKARAAFAHVAVPGARNGAGYFATLPAAAAHLEPHPRSRTSATSRTSISPRTGRPVLLRRGHGADPVPSGSRV